MAKKISPTSSSELFIGDKFSGNNEESLLFGRISPHVRDSQKFFGALEIGNLRLRQSREYFNESVYNLARFLEWNAKIFATISKSVVKKIMAKVFNLKCLLTRNKICVIRSDVFKF